MRDHWDKGWKGCQELEVCVNSGARSDAKVYSDSTTHGSANALFSLTVQGYVWITQLNARRGFIRNLD